MNIKQTQINYSLLQKLEKIDSYSREAIKIKEKLVKDNIPLVINRLKAIKRGSPINDDDFQNGLLGLAETINVFDVEKSKSLGTLGHYRIKYNMDKYDNHTGGIKVPAIHKSDIKYYVKEYIEDRQDDETEPQKETKDLIIELAREILSEFEFNIFVLRTFSKVSFRELADRFDMDRLFLMRTYKCSFNSVVDYCRSRLNAVNI